MWAAVIIKIRMMSKFKARGPLSERYRTSIRHVLVFQRMCKGPILEQSAAEKVYMFLHDLAKRRECIIVFNNTVNRVLMVQKKFKKHLYNRLYAQAKLIQSIVAGLNTLRTIFIREKAFQHSYADTLDCINALTSSSKDIIEHIVRLVLDLPACVHSVNLVRWYALFRNHGVYNTDLYFVLYDKVKQLKST